MSPKPRSEEAPSVLVTGAGSGIGRATASVLANRSTKLVLLDVDTKGLEETAEIIRGDTADEPLLTVADVSDEGSVIEAFELIETSGIALGGLVINAAIEPGTDAPVDDLDLDVWNQILAVNLTGAFLTAKHGVRAIRGNGGGSIVMTASPTSLFGVAGTQHGYSASKGGIIALMKAMAAQYASSGIRVNAIMPGFTRTPANDNLLRNADATAELLSGIPLGRPGEPEEIAETTAFLLSSRSSYVTGSIYSVDGGMTAI